MMVDRDPKLIDIGELSEKDILFNSQQFIFRDARGRVRWKLPGNTDDLNLLIGIKNIQGLFLEKFSEFVQLFPADNQGRIEETRRVAAAGFIADRVSTQRQFNSVIGGSARNAPYFGRSYQIAIQKSFEPWGLQVYKLSDSESIVVRDGKGNIRWSLPGYSPEQNEQLAISNIQALFLEGFPEFNLLFSWRDGMIEENQREDAKQFITEKLKSKRAFIATFTGTPLAIPAFGGSKRILIYKSFSPWGIKFEQLEKAPEGWMTVNALGAYLHTKDRHITKILDRFRENHPDWVDEYLDGKNRAKEYLAPELISIVKSEFLRHEAPEGWITESSLEKQLKRAYGFYIEFADKFRADHPEWFRFYRSASSQNTEYWAPELIAIIIEEDNSYPLPPNGWSTPGILSAQLSRSIPYIRKIARDCSNNHPEWINNNYRSVIVGRPSEHYAPELLEEIKRRLNRKIESVSPEEANEQLLGLLAET